MDAQSVVMFGGTGFIGSHIAARLSDHGVPTVVPTRHASHGMHLMPLGVDIVQADPYDDTALRKLVAGRAAVINLVGILHSRRGDPYGPDFRRAHVELPRRIAAACAAEGVPRYLHMSALGADRDGPSMYQRSKADGEGAATSEPAVATTIFRPSVVFGPEDKFLNTFARLQRHLPVVPLACAHARFQPVFVGDVAEAFVRALLDPHTVGFTYELGGPQVYELGELVRLAGRYAGHERKVIALPDGLARLQARVFELLPGEPVITRDNLDSMKVDNVVHPSTNNKVLTTTALGIKLTALESVAPQYLAPSGGLDVLRTRAGR
ncbi:complex I NDUFA9 subunit family protein [Massilia pinisoli]|uniref:Complex I NDUFA9 subunit family protein n=1 Tax=Massilia pinisoli TaxID=1772194 RepID=A0ABT1ZLP9_9BURK|nr:complex I NDUFA9 subunit family protein [Massilia pinisoli]MCS0580813.1 complex I NDUFA9 subunit family protein [Massilia pinisoli]